MSGSVSGSGQSWGSPATLYSSDFLPLLQALYLRSVATSGDPATAAQNSAPTGSPVGDALGMGSSKDGSNASQNSLASALSGKSGQNFSNLLGSLGSLFGNSSTSVADAFTPLSTQAPGDAH